MTPFLPLLHGAQVEVGYSLGGQTIENRLWYAFDNPPFGVPELQGLADGVAGWHVLRILPYLSSDLELLSVQAVRWDDHLGDVFASSPVHLFGGALSKSYSANVMVRVNLNWPTDVRARKNAQYVPGIPDSAVSLNTVDITFAHNLFEGYAALIDAARLFSPVLNWRWVLASSYAHGSLRSSLRVARCIGPDPESSYRLGQCRGRLP